jgi:hypothetical protein
MFGTKKAVVLSFALLLLAVILSCSEDTNYDQRTVVYVGGLNQDRPYLCDVLSQGDSIYNEDMVTFKLVDDAVREDWIEVTFYNKPYSTVIEPGTGTLGDFLVTGYDVNFIPYDNAPEPVRAFSGTTSILVPASGSAVGAILLVPFAAKNVNPLLALQYSPNEIMSQAHFVFRGHYIQTDTEVEFEANLSVNFADPLLTTQDEEKLNQ